MSLSKNWSLTPALYSFIVTRFLYTALARYRPLSLLCRVSKVTMPLPRDQVDVICQNGGIYLPKRRTNTQRNVNDFRGQFMALRLLLNHTFL